MNSLLRFVVRGRVSPRRATHFLCFAKERKQRKATPTVCVPCAALRGNLRCSTPAGVRRTRFAQTAAALIPPPSALLGAYRRGWERVTFASLGPNSQDQQPTAQLIPTTAARSAAVAWWPSEAKARSVSKPLCMRRGAEGFADQGRSCLSEASSADPAKHEHRRLPRSEAQGSQTVGSPFFCLRFFGEAKKSRSPAGARPGLGKQAPVNVHTGASQ
jgi:hypothetical protein